MIITGAQARIKDAAASSFLPNLTTEGILASVSVTKTPATRIPIRTLRSTKVRGVYRGAREQFTITYDVLTSPTIADIYFRRILDAASLVTGKRYLGTMPTHQTNPFQPIAISGAAWRQSGDAPATLSVTFEYFHAGSEDLEDIEPYTGDLFTTLETEFEVDVTPDDEPKIPVEDRSFELQASYEVTRTLDGYAGVRYSFFTLVQAVAQYDDAYEYAFPYDSYLDPFSVNNSSVPEYVTNVLGSSITEGGHRVQNRSRQGILLAATDLLTTETIFGEEA